MVNAHFNLRILFNLLNFPNKEESSYLPTHKEKVLRSFTESDYSQAATYLKKLKPSRTPTKVIVVKYVTEGNDHMIYVVEQDAREEMLKGDQALRDKKVPWL